MSTAVHTLQWKRRGRSSNWLAESSSCWAYVQRDWKAGRWDWYVSGAPSESGVKRIYGDAPNLKAARDAAGAAGDLFFGAR